MGKNTFRIIVDGNALDQMTSELIFGPIFFDTGGSFFPEFEWTDFPLVIISWFSKVVMELPLKQNKTFEVDFLEGPFKLKLKLDNHNNCVVALIEGEKLAGSKEEIIETITVPFNFLFEEVITACKALFESVKKSKGLKKSKDYEDLETAYNLLLKFNC